MTNVPVAGITHIVFLLMKIVGISVLSASGKMTLFIASDDDPSDFNHGITLKKARNNYLEFGACEKEMMCHVRTPENNEKEQL